MIECKFDFGTQSSLVFTGRSTSSSPSFNWMVSVVPPERGGRAKFGSGNHNWGWDEIPTVGSGMGEFCDVFLNGRSCIEVDTLAGGLSTLLTRSGRKSKRLRTARLMDRGSR